MALARLLNRRSTGKGNDAVGFSRLRNPPHPARYGTATPNPCRYCTGLARAQRVTEPEARLVVSGELYPRCATRKQ